MINRRNLLALLIALFAMGACFVAGVWARPKLQPAARAVRKWLADPRDPGTVPEPASYLSNGVNLAAPLPRFEPGVAVAGDKIYLFSGFIDDDLHVTQRADVYDTNAGSWQRIADVPVAVTHAGLAVVGDEIWIAGGFVGHNPGPPTTAVWRYHIPTNQWKTAPQLPEARGSGGLAFVQGQLHYFGGVKPDRLSDSADHWSLTPGPDAVWVPRAPLLIAKNHFGLVARDGVVHLLGGQFGHDAKPKDIDDHQVYVAATDSWRPAPRLPRRRSHVEPGSFLHQGRIIVAGGRSNPISVLHDVTAFDPATGAWTELPGLPEPMRAPVLRVVGSSLYFGLGGTTDSGVSPSSWWMKYPVHALGLPSAAPRMP
ncbi:MAG: hypothetical protein J0L64_03580 [Acidobacteria bacterium]|nr:hypothetical protein [Acidobacteriota bacterium]